MTRPMSDTKEIAQKFLDALASDDAGKYEDILAEDAAMRVARWDGGEVYRPRDRVIKRLMGEWSAWRDPTLETFTVLGEESHAAVEFRIQATEQQRYVEHNRSAFLTIRDGRVQIIDLYCPMPLPSARRKSWIAPATLTEDELKRLIDTNRHAYDVREWAWPNLSWHLSLSICYGGLGGMHPSANEVGDARWTAEEADAKIEELLAYHRERNQGFHWEVSTFDTPPDLMERLERHGFVRAGYNSVMARVGLDHLEDIPVNPHVEMEMVDGSSDDSIEAAIQIAATCFSTPPEQIDQLRPGIYKRMKDPKVREEELYFIARLNGKPVGTGRVTFKAGTGLLTNGATLPEYPRPTCVLDRAAVAIGAGTHARLSHRHNQRRTYVAARGRAVWV